MNLFCPEHIKIMRLDEFLIKTGLAQNNFQARGLIMSSNVLVNNTPVEKVGYHVSDTDKVRIRKTTKWVSRGAEKLLAPIEEWSWPVINKTFLDIGSSTGGFTHALLEHGAKRVAAIDVGYGLLDSKIRDDDRVVILERTHICELTTDMLDFDPDYFVCDVSFISLRKVLPCLRSLKIGWSGIVLFKPQFEVDFHSLEKGIVRSELIREKALIDFTHFCNSLDVTIEKQMVSPLKGQKGNVEYLLSIVIE